MTYSRLSRVAKPHTFDVNALPELKAFWDEFDRFPLPRVNHCRDFFAHMHPSVAEEIDKLGKTSFEPPPIKIPFDPKWAIRYDDDWVVHLGRLTYDHDKMASNALARKAKEAFGEGAVLNGLFYYPPGGYIQWHTDFEGTGRDRAHTWRLYFIKTAEDDKSWIQFLDNDSGEVIKAMDRNATFNVLHLIPEPPLWHAVYSHTHRYSTGIKLGDEEVDNLLKRLDDAESAKSG